MKKLFILFIIFLIVDCSGPKFDDETAAIVGKEKITREELMISYELFPYISAARKGEAGLRSQLDLLIEKKLFACEGRERNLAKDPQVLKAVNWFRNNELKKALYRNEIEANIRITEADLENAYHKENMQLHVRHLFAKTEEQIHFIQDALKNGMDWGEIAKLTFTDSTLAGNGGDLGWISYGDMESAFEDSAYTMPVGEISEPVRTRYGYHLIQVMNVRKNMLTSQDDFQAKKSKLEAHLFRQQLRERTAEFIGKFMDAKEVQMVNRVFDLLVSKIREGVIDKQEPFLPTMKDEELSHLSLGLESYRNDILITFRGGQWTIGDFMDKLRNIPVTHRPSLESPGRFRRDIGIMIRNEFLAAEAERLGLADDPIVKKEVKHWEDEFIFSQLWQSITDTVRLSADELMAFYETHASRYWLPDRVHVQEILVLTRREAEKLLDQLKNGQNFEELAQKHSLRTAAALEGGDLGWLSAGQMGNITTTAFRMRVGEISGPVKVEGGYSVIRVKGREKQRQKTFDEAKEQVLTDIRPSQNNDIYDHWVKRIRSRVRVQINDSLITRLAKELRTEGHILMPGIR